MVPTKYSHPTNDKIKFWDLPGIGTRNLPDIDEYCKNVSVENYDAFLILSHNRFTENDRRLAEKVKSLHKSFFFVRPHIDEARKNARRSEIAFDEKKTLDAIKDDCLANLKDLGLVASDVFLISNFHPTKWDFPRLEKAILDALPAQQKECLTLSLKNSFFDMLKRKVAILRDRIWKVALAAGAGATSFVQELSFAADLAIIMAEIDLYRSQLGLPEQDSNEFRSMSPRNQENIRNWTFSTTQEVVNTLRSYSPEAAAKELVRLIPFASSLIAEGIWCGSFIFLRYCLDRLEEAGLAVLNQMVENPQEDDA